MAVDGTNDDQEMEPSKSTHHRLQPQSATGPIIHSELNWLFTILPISAILMEVHCLLVFSEQATVVNANLKNTNYV